MEKERKERETEKVEEKEEKEKGNKSKSNRERERNNILFFSGSWTYIGNDNLKTNTNCLFPISLHNFIHFHRSNLRK
jgi:hypothetical protein